MSVHGASPRKGSRVHLPIVDSDEEDSSRMLMTGMSGFSFDYDGGSLPVPVKRPGSGAAPRGTPSHASAAAARYAPGESFGTESEEELPGSGLGQGQDSFKLHSYGSLVGPAAPSERWRGDAEASPGQNGTGAGADATSPRGFTSPRLGTVHERDAGSTNEAGLAGSVESKVNPVSGVSSAAQPRDLPKPKPGTGGDDVGGGGGVQLAPGVRSVPMSELKEFAVNRRWRVVKQDVRTAVKLQRQYVGEGPWEPPESSNDTESSGADELERAESVLEAMNAETHVHSYSHATITVKTLHHHGGAWKCLKRYHKFGKLVGRHVANANWFKSFIMGIIGIAAITVGMQTYALDSTTKFIVSSILEPAVQWVFVGECVVMIVSFGRRPWMYFNDGWNVFDFSVVVSSFLPIGGSSVTTLRLLRLLRVLKLVKALPKLRMLVLGLLNSLSSIGYISLLLGLQFYLYAVLGVMAFGEGDPYYFGTLDRALVALWQAATGDDWSDQLYTGIFGCSAPEASDPAYSGTKASLCTSPHPFGFVLPTAYFLSFQLLAGLMLLNLFVGAILMAVQDAKDEVNTGDILTVQVLRGEDLEAADSALLGGASDPFVVVHYGSAKQKTKVRKNTLNPVWPNAEFVFPMDNENDKGKEPQVVSFYVYDWDRFGGNDPLGYFHLKIDTIPFEREYTFRMELEDVTRGWLVVKLWKSTLGPPVDGDDSKCGKMRSLQFMVEDGLSIISEMMDIAQSLAKKQAAQRTMIKKLASIRKVMSHRIAQSLHSFRSRGSSKNGVPKSPSKPVHKPLPAVTPPIMAAVNGRARAKMLTPIARAGAIQRDPNRAREAVAVPPSPHRTTSPDAPAAVPSGGAFRTPPHVSYRQGAPAPPPDAQEGSQVNGKPPTPTGHDAAAAAVARDTSLRSLDGAQVANALSAPSDPGSLASPGPLESAIGSVRSTGRNSLRAMGGLSLGAAGSGSDAGPLTPGDRRVSYRTHGSRSSRGSMGTDINRLHDDLFPGDDARGSARPGRSVRASRARGTSRRGRSRSPATGGMGESMQMMQELGEMHAEVEALLSHANVLDADSAGVNGASSVAAVDDGIGAE